MHAVILNSGVGSRLGKYTEKNPKCMVELADGETILLRQLRLLQAVGIHDVIISTGYLSDMLMDYVKELSLDISYTWVHNEMYLDTNYIVSMDKIPAVNDDIVLMHGDLVFSEKVLRQLIDSDVSGVIVDTSLELPEKDFKAQLTDGKVDKIGINYFGEDCVALQPLYYLKNKDWVLWKEEIAGFCAQGNTKVYAEEAYNQISNMQICPIDIKGDLCAEIDNEQDLMRVREKVKGEL